MWEFYVTHKSAVSLRLKAEVERAALLAKAAAFKQKQENSK